MKGYAALITVLFIGSISLLLVSTMAFSSIDQLNTISATKYSNSGTSLVEACGEDALMELQQSSSYSGGTITRPEGTCNITVSTSASVYQLNVETTDNSFKKTLYIEATRGSAISIQDWKII